MKSLSAGLQSHLDTGATTLCWCWRLTRTDGTELGFTDHDRDLVFDSTTFEADSGFTASEIASSVGLSVDNLEAEGALQSGHLNETDLAKGLYDNAVVEVWRVNWADVSERVLVRQGNLGEVSLNDGAFVAEIRGLAHELNQEQGRAYLAQCDADLGDTRCTVDLDLAAFKGSGTVATITTGTRFTASGLDSFDGGWFTRGFLTWDTGGNAGQKMEVKLHAKADGTVTLGVWQTPAVAISSGDTFTIKAGCDKQFTTCKDKFSNVANFRGFPHIPGNDFVVQTASPGDPVQDGESQDG